MKKRTLLAVQGPTQFIAAYISLLWYEKNITQSETEVMLVVYDSFVPVENEKFLRSSIMDLSAVRKWSQIVFIDGKEMQGLSLNKYSKCKLELKEKLHNYEFDHIFIARDYGSFGTQLILNTYPTATHIEYGDSFGLIGNETKINVSFHDFLHSPIPALKSFIKKYLYGHFPRRFSFAFSILSIPIDFSENALKNKTIIIPDRQFVIDAMLKLSSGLTELVAFCNQLLSNTHGQCNLYLLSNFTNSKFTTQENELKIYEEIIHETALPGSTIILKNHPRGSNIVLERLHERLGEKFDVKIIEMEKFNFYPIELWVPLMQKCRVFPIFSTSVVSIAYFFSKKVEMSLGEARIRKYVNANKIDETIQGESMCYEAISALENWDMRSPLWQKST